MKALRFVVLAGAVLAGCSSSSNGSKGSGGTSATGGIGSGGKSGTGGGSGSGGGSGGAVATGSGGNSGTGGKNGSGGAPATGGASGSAGTATGGAGGKSASGGATASGSGGTTASGGSTGLSGSGGRAGSGSGGVPGSGGGAGSGVTVATPTFDWVGVVGSGQSLSTGFTPPSLTMPYYNNLMLQQSSTSFPGGGAMNPTAPVPGTMDMPWDTTLSDLAVVPLVEPLRAAGSGFPRPYPINLWGETHHGAMAREITHFVTTATPGADYVTVHTVVGESGQGITALIKQAVTTGDTGRAFQATLFEAGALTRLAKAAGKTYGVGVIVMTHGETDADPPNAAYKDQLVQLLADYNADLAPITGQSYRIPMYISQQHAYPNGASSKGKRPDVNNMQWQLGVDHKGDFVCTGPKYQYPANPNNDGVHLSVTGAELLGEKVAQAYYQRAVLGQDWQPLQPVSVERSGRVVTVHFNVPVPPLNWDTTFDAPAITEWKNGNGFELRTDTANVTIASVAIAGDSVQITASSDLPTGSLTVGYALTSQGVQLKNHSKAVRWGQLRDSDPFAGVTTMMPNPNYCVSFELPVP